MRLCRAATHGKEKVDGNADFSRSERAEEPILYYRKKGAFGLIFDFSYFLSCL
jgi:hypothetical protein